MSKVVHRKKRLSSFKLIVLGFAAVIFVGALLLMLPVSSVSGTQTPFHEALFTSVSAVCVTGLVVQDTGSYWSSFGQAVILLLIQTGGGEHEEKQMEDMWAVDSFYQYQILKEVKK